MHMKNKSEQKLSFIYGATLEFRFFLCFCSMFLIGFAKITVCTLRLFYLGVLPQHGHPLFQGKVGEGIQKGIEQHGGKGGGSSLLRPGHKYAPSLAT